MDTPPPVSLCEYDGHGCDFEGVGGPCWGEVIGSMPDYFAGTISHTCRGHNEDGSYEPFVVGVYPPECPEPMPPRGSTAHIPTATVKPWPRPGIVHLEPVLTHKFIAGTDLAIEGACVGIDTVSGSDGAIHEVTFHVKVTLDDFDALRMARDEIAAAIARVTATYPRRR